MGIFHTVFAEQSVETLDFFSDLNSDSLVGQAAANLRASGVIQGYDDGTFQPERPVNRAELAKFLLLAKGRSVDMKHNNGRFPDVKEGEWYVKYIIDAADLGIIDGYPSGNFKPAQTVNTAEFLKMLSRTFDLPENQEQDFADVDTDAWYAPYVGNVPALDLFPNRDPGFLEPGRDMTRGEVAIALYRIMRPKLEEENDGDGEGTSSSIPSSNMSELLVKSQNQNAQLSMTYAGKGEELVLPITVSLVNGEATIKSFQIELSSTNFLKKIWFDGGVKKSANRRLVTVPVGKEIQAGASVPLAVFASVQDGLERGDSIQVSLKKIEWEKDGNIYAEDVSIDGIELMIF